MPSKVKATTSTSFPTTTPAAETEVPETTLVNVVKKKELIERVTQASGVKRSDAKKVMEAVLKELGDILQEGGELNVPPLGKLSVNRHKEVSNAHVLITKLRRPNGMLAGGNASGEDEALEDTASS